MRPGGSHIKLRKTDKTARLARLSLGRILLASFLISTFFSAWVLETEARSSKRSVSVRSRHGSGSSSRSGRAKRVRLGNASGRGARGGRASRNSRRGGSARSPRNHAPVASHHGPTAAQIRRQETSGNNDLENRRDMERSYRTYDQGLTEWLAGNYSQAAKLLNESYEMYSDFHGSRDILDAFYLYDLGQAAEAAGDLSLAKNSYQRSLRRRPDFADCCIRLSAILTKNGETALALVYARRLAEKNPQDPRSQFLLATMLERAGFVEEGKVAKDNYKLLMKGGTVSRRQAPATPVEGDSKSDSETENEPEDKKDSVRKNDVDTDSGDKKDSEKESGAPESAPKETDSKTDSKDQ